MRKAIFSIFIFVLLSCGPQGYINNKTIEYGQDLKIDHPNEDFIINNHLTRIRFGVIGKGDSLKEPRITVTETDIKRIAAVNDLITYTDQIVLSNQTTLDSFGVRFLGKFSQKYFPNLVTLPIQQENIFHSDYKSTYFRVPFYTTGVQADIAYTQTTLDAKYFTIIPFPNSYFTENREVYIEVPAWLDVEIQEKNFQGYEIIKTEIRDAYAKSRKKPKPIKIKESKDEKTGKDTKPEVNTEMPGAIKAYSYKIKKLPFWRHEESAPGYQKNIPHLLVLVKSYKSVKKTNENLLANTADLYKWYKSLVNEIKEENDTIKSITDKIVANCKNDREKMDSIFYWIQDNIRYLAFEEGLAGFQPDPAIKVFRNKYGDCKGMANLAKNMLVSQGIDARLTWIGTRDIKYDYSIPSLAVDNHMITTVYLMDSSKFFIDPTETFIRSGEYAARIQGRPVLIENKDSYIIDTIPEYDYKVNLVHSKYTLNLDGKVLKGKAEKIYNGETKRMVMYLIRYTPSEKKENRIKSLAGNDVFNFKLANIIIPEKIEREPVFNLSYDIEIDNHVLNKGRSFINLNINKELFDNKIKKERYSDYDFNFKKWIKNEVELIIPNGSKVEYMPKAIKAETDEYLIHFEYKVEGNKLKLYKEIIIKTGYISKSNFTKWNELLENAVSFYSDYVIIN